jgi:hypothetical protein
LSSIIYYPADEFLKKCDHSSCRHAKSTHAWFYTAINHLTRLLLRLLHYHLLRLLKLRYRRLLLRLLHYHLLRQLKLRYRRLLHCRYYDDYCDDDHNNSNLCVRTQTADLTLLLL